MKVAVSGGQLRRFHQIATIAWLFLILPTLLWWRDSILWVALMSVWANVAGHFGAWQAARAEVAAAESNGMNNGQHE